MYGNSPYQSYPYQSNYGGMPSYAQRGYGSTPQPMAQPQPQVQHPMQMPQQMPPMELPIQDIKYVNRVNSSR